LTDPTQSNESRWQRLRRHGAFQAAVLFASAAWLGLQAADLFGIPTTFVRVLGILLLGIFAVLAAYAWFDTREVDATKPLAKGRNRTVAVVAAAVVFVVLGAAAWIARPKIFGGVKPGADVIAVLPFSTSGPSVALLGEGLVDLLSTNLNAVGPIRTVDPRTTLHRWRQASSSGGVDLDGSLAIGKAVNAGSVLMGSVVEAGGRVRLNAELFAVNGNRLAATEVQGSADSVFTLVDELSVRLLQDVWQDSKPIPELRVSSLTTSSPAALRSFLRGEQFFRHTQWDSARASFEQAVAEDATFALAYARLSETFGWTETLGAPAARRASEQAEKYGDRLPARDRTLLHANRLHEAADLATIDTMRAFVLRYPDDAAGWHMLGDAQFHAMAIVDLSDEQIYRPFDKVLELDPSFTPALEHPMQLAILLGDSARYARYLGLMEAAGAQSQRNFFRTMGEVRWGPHDTRLAKLGSGMRNDVRNSYDGNRITTTYGSAVLADTVPSWEEMRASFDTTFAVVGASSGVRAQAMIYEAQLAAGMGRVRATTALLDTLRAINQNLSMSVVFSILGAHITLPGLDGPEMQFIRNPPATGVFPVYRFWLAYIANTEGNAAKAKQMLAMVPDTMNPGLPRPYIAALRGLIRVTEGDTAGGIAQVTENVRAAGYGATANYAGLFTLETLLLELKDPAKREHTFERIDDMMAREPVLQVLLLGRLAEAYEQVGAYDRAADVLARFIAIWETGDPEVQPVVDAARRALQRVTSERTG
jgi:TolB-like protein